MDALRTQPHAAYTSVLSTNTASTHNWYLLYSDMKVLSILSNRGILDGTIWTNN
jgi:hypothetical protein